MATPLGVTITDPDGSKHHYTMDEAVNMGYKVEDLTTGTAKTAYKTESGSYSPYISQSASPIMFLDKESGKISVTVPDQWKDDEYVKKLTDEYTLTALSKNYKIDENVKYQDPYDETKQDTTEEYIAQLDRALKDRYAALEAVAPTKSNLITRFGGTEAKNDAINKLSTDDIIVMLADTSDDKSWIPIPAYMLLAYPQIEKLETYRNGFVAKYDFLNNFYNIEKGKITERQAHGIATAPETVLAEIENLSPDEIAKTIAFWGVVDKNAPQRSGISTFLRGSDAMAQGFYGGLYDWATDSANLLVNVAKLSWWTGGVDVKTPMMENAFIEGAGLSTGKIQERVTELSYTDPNAAAALRSGYAQGEIAGKAIDMVVSTIAFGEAAKAITGKIVSKGAKKTAKTMAEQATLSEAMGKFTKAQTEALNQAAKEEILSTAKNLSRMPSLTQNFFNQTIAQAKGTFMTTLGGTEATLNAMSLPQLINVVNSATKVATSATLANTALGILSNFTLAAVVHDKQLTTKVLSSRATDVETAQWIQNMMLDTAKLTAISLGTTVFSEAFGRAIKGTLVEEELNLLKQKASKVMTGISSKLSEPWLKFRQWFLDRKMVAQQVSNATANSAEAVREAVILNEARAYTASQSTALEPTGEMFGDVSSLDLPESFKAAVRSAYGDILGKAAQTGVLVDPVSGTLSPFQESQANLVELENQLTGWGDIQTAESIMIKELVNPDIEPVISQQVQEASDANSELLRVEQEAGLLDGDIIQTNKSLGKEDYGDLNFMHSPASSVYAVRSHEMQIVIDKAKAEGVELENYPDYEGAKERLEKAASNLPIEVRNVIDNRVLPTLRNVEHSLVNRMINDWGVYPKSFVEGLRASGRYGEDGKDWLRLVAKKDLPKGAYMPFSKMVQRDNTIDLNRDKILEDEDITWVGTGLAELIQEAALAKAEKDFLSASEKATGLTPEIVVSGEKTAGARDIKEYRTSLNAAISTGIRSFKEDMSFSSTVYKKAKIEAELVKKEINETGGIWMMDIDDLRGIMQENNILTTGSIIDQDTLKAFYSKSSRQGKNLLSRFRGGDGKVSFEKYSDMQASEPENFEMLLDKVDRANASRKKEVRASEEVQLAANEYGELWVEFANDNIMPESFSYIVEEPSSQTDEELISGSFSKAKKKGKKTNQKKYDLNKEELFEDLDNAIDGMLWLTERNKKASLAIDGVIKLQGVEDTAVRREFILLENILNKEGKKLFKKDIREIAEKIVDGNIPKTSTVIKGNLDSLYGKVEKAINEKLETRLSMAKAQLESSGEVVDSPTVTELLDSYRKDIAEAKADTTVVKTTNSNGEIEYRRVSPSIADIYNNRPIYTPLSTTMQIFANFALLKRISTTNLNPRSFAKQSVSDPALAFATTGALPGTLHAMRNEIAAKFGTRILNEIEKHDLTRFQNIQAIAEREGISPEEAALTNIQAKSEVRLPFTTINQEALRQANIAKYGNDVALQKRRKTINRKINSGLRKVSDKLGKPNDMREEYVRRLAGEKAFLDALEKGYNYEQAESFRQHAQDNATTNFRQKSTVFNNLRTTTPYLTSGISGAKSFWKMFQLDPVGMSARIFTGFVLPIMYFMGEIVENEELRKKYEALAEYEKSDHIIIAVDGELIRIPVGEELGGYVNLITHIVEAIHGENKYDFWLLMLNDMVGLYPTIDLTGFTDPEMWQPISGEAPSFLEVMDNGISQILSQTMPPIVQSLYMSISGRDLYTGKKVNTGYISIDNDGNAVISSYSQSQFAKALANIVGGDARVIEKVTSGIVGTTFLHVLDTITSAVQYASSSGEEGSLTTAVEKAIEDISNPYVTNGYAELGKRWNAAVSELYDKKQQIVNDKRYQKYNQTISNTKDSAERQKLINKRNELLADFQKNVENLVKGFRDAGGELDRKRFATAVSLLTFEDAIRADRQFMGLNTDYWDAYTQAMRTLNSYGISNPDGVSMLGYIYTDEDGNPQVKMWTPSQMQVIQDAFYEQGDIHRAHIEAILKSGSENSISNLRKTETSAEQPYWDKYNSTGKLSNAEWDAIDDLRKAFNAKVVLALKGYIDSYGANYILSNDAVMDYLEDIIKVPSSYERVNGRYVSSGGGKLNKQQGFAESYIKAIFGVK